MHPDTADYPDSHTFFCYSTNDGHVSPLISGIIETVYEQRSRTVRDLIKWLLNSFAKTLSPDHPEQRSNDDDEVMDDADDEENARSDDGSETDMFDDHDDDGFGDITSLSNANVDNSALQRSVLCLLLSAQSRVHHPLAISLSV